MSPIWQRHALGEVGLWEAELRGSVEEWAEVGGLCSESVARQQQIVDAILHYGDGVLDAIKANISKAMEAAQEEDNRRFLLVTLLSSAMEERAGKIEIHLGRRAEGGRGSLAYWIWQHLPRERRGWRDVYRTASASVWAGALCWVLGVTGNGACLGWCLPEVLWPARPMRMCCAAGQPVLTST